jgi:hypothetical protein
MRRLRSVILVLSVVLLLGWLAWNTAKDHKRSVAFREIQIGVAGKKDLVGLMGTPDEILQGCGYLYAKPASGCVEEWVYGSFWGYLLGEAWTVQLDADGLVLDTAHFVSP